MELATTTPKGWPTRPSAARSRLAGLGDDRVVPWSVEQDVAVFNLSPRPSTDVVRIPLDGYPAMVMEAGAPDIHPLSIEATRPGVGFTVDGAPARAVASEDQRRVRWMPGQQPLDLEVVVDDVPAFGWRRLGVRLSDPIDDEEDDGREIEAGSVRVVVAEDGTFDVTFGSRRWSGLLGVEDQGDRGDSYDFDPAGSVATVVPTSVEVRRARREWTPAAHRHARWRFRLSSGPTGKIARARPCPIDSVSRRGSSGRRPGRPGRPPRALRT